MHVVGEDPSLELLAAPGRLVVEPCFDPGGEDARLGLTEEKPEASAGGELGFDCARRSKGLPRFTDGVEAVRGTFGRLSPPCRKDWLLLRLPSHSPPFGSTKSVVVPPIVTRFAPGGPAGKRAACVLYWPDMGWCHGTALE